LLNFWTNNLKYILMIWIYNILLYNPRKNTTVSWFFSFKHKFEGNIMVVTLKFSIVKYILRISNFKRFKNIYYFFLSNSFTQSSLLTHLLHCWRDGRVKLRGREKVSCFSHFINLFFFKLFAEKILLIINLWFSTVWRHFGQGFSI